MIALRAKLIEEFKEQVPDSLSFSVGYFEGQAHSKLSLVSGEDLNAMYTTYRSGLITLWCDGRSEPTEDSASGRSKRKKEETSSRRQEKESEVEEVYTNLVSMHKDSYTTPQLRLWARMVCSNLHADLEMPPDIPAFSGKPAQRKSRQRESVSDVIGSAAVAIVNALKNDTPNTSGSIGTPGSTGNTSGMSVISPAKSVELRMKNYEQLRYLYQLFDDGIITQKEFAEQKNDIMIALKKL